jgi:hypothetical protein
MHPMAIEHAGESVNRNRMLHSTHLSCSIFLMAGMASWVRTSLARCCRPSPTGFKLLLNRME